MATRAKPLIDAPTGDAAEAPGVIPQGVDADVTVKYRRRVAPPPTDSAQSDLDQLALDADDDLAPGDQLDQFLEIWGNYRGYNCEVVRLPDPADRRMIGNQYPKPNFGEIERLGGIPFDPLTLVSTLQMINGNSGGIFRIWLTDQAGQRIPGAQLYRVAIGNPPGSQHVDPRFNPQPQAAPQPAPAYVPPPKSETEKQIEDIQRRLFQAALERAINPPPPPAPPVAPQMSDEDRLGMMILTKSDLLPNVISKLTEAVSAGEKAQSMTWKDKAMDYVTNNPQVGMQLAGAAERVVTGLTNLLGQLLPGAPPVVPVAPTQHAPQATPAAQAAPAPAPADNTIDAEDDDNEEDEDMAILDQLFALLNDTREIKPDDEVFITLRREHPIKFKMIVTMIARASDDEIVAYVSEQSPLYKSLLESPVTGTHLKARLSLLRELCINAVTPQPTAPASE